MARALVSAAVDGQQGQGVHARKLSKHQGVCWRKTKNKWLAYIRYGGKQHHLGHFNDEEDAARAYDSAAREQHASKVFTREHQLNFPGEGEQGVSASNISKYRGIKRNFPAVSGEVRGVKRRRAMERVQQYVKQQQTQQEQAQSLHPLANKYKVKLAKCESMPADVTIETSSELVTDFEKWRALPATHFLYEAPARGKVLAIGKALNLLGEKYPSQECSGVMYGSGLGEERARKRVIKKLWTAMAGEMDLQCIKDIE
jgi:hypothetical protein